MELRFVLSDINLVRSGVECRCKAKKESRRSGAIGEETGFDPHSERVDERAVEIADADRKNNSPSNNQSLGNPAIICEVDRTEKKYRIKRYCMRKGYILFFNGKGSHAD